MDFLIQNATVFDGQAIMPQRLDVGIRNHRISYVGDPLHSSAGQRVIDGRGLYLCPGFIDTHASTGLGYRLPHAADHKLFQGVTTEITGNCGTSTAPVSAKLAPTMRRLAEEIGFTFDWETLSDWVEGVQAYGLPFNIGTHVGHSTLHGSVCSGSSPTRREMRQMCTLLDQAMRDGALGFSTGLVYAPGSFSRTVDLIELAGVAARHQGIYATHIRNEREELEAAVEEAICIGQGSGARVLISHLKAGEKPYWGEIPGIIRKIETARAESIEVSFEVYPYAATSTKLRTFVPKEVMEEGVSGMVEHLRTEEWRRRSVEWLEARQTAYDSMVLIRESVPGGKGRSIGQIADQKRQCPGNTIVDVLLSDPDAWIIYHCMSQDDVDAAVLWNDSIICSDSWSHPVNAPNQFGDPHPRTFGAFTRFLERYALRTSRMPFGAAIRKITSVPARWLNLTHRGCIAEGYFADLVLLDPSRLKEKATYDQPRQFSEGTKYLWVNGTLVIEGAELKPALPGQVIRRQSSVLS